MVLCGGFSAEVRAKKMRQDGCTEFISASLGGGIAHISPLCYTESEIPAALRAVGHTAVFRTRCRRKEEGERICAAKRHIEPDTARHPAARNFKTISPQGDGNNLSIELIILRLFVFQNHIPARGRKLFRATAQNTPILRDFKTISPQGDGNYGGDLIMKEITIKISKPYPRKGTETDYLFQIYDQIV